MIKALPFFHHYERLSKLGMKPDELQDQRDLWYKSMVTDRFTPKDIGEVYITEGKHIWRHENNMLTCGPYVNILNRLRESINKQCMDFFVISLPVFFNPDWINKNGLK